MTWPPGAERGVGASVRASQTTAVPLWPPVTITVPVRSKAILITATTGRLGGPQRSPVAREDAKLARQSCLRQSAVRLRLPPRPSAGHFGTAQRSPPSRDRRAVRAGSLSTVRIRREFGTNCALNGNPPACSQGRYHGSGLAGRDVPDPRPRPIAVGDDDAVAVRAERRSERGPGCLSDSTSLSRAGIPDDGVGGGVHARDEAAIRAPRRAAGRAATWPQRGVRALGGCGLATARSCPRRCSRRRCPTHCPCAGRRGRAREFGLNAVLTALCQPGVDRDSPAATATVARCRRPRRWRPATRPG